MPTKFLCSFIALVNVCYMLTLCQACVRCWETEEIKHCPARSQDQRCDGKGPLDPESLQLAQWFRDPHTVSFLVLALCGQS